MIGGNMGAVLFGKLLSDVIGGGKKDAPLVQSTATDEVNDDAKKAKKARTIIQATAGGAVGEEVGQVGFGLGAGERIFGN